jgi:hypothetical protein
VIAVVSEYSEVYQTWRLFIEQEPEQKPKDQNPSSWARAAGRLLESASGTALQRLELIVEMYDRLQTSELLPHVSAAINGLQETELNDGEVQHSQRMLEQLVASLLPGEILDKARQILTLATAKMLADYGYTLSLEDINSTAQKLVKWGDNEDAAIEASRAAIEGQIDELKHILSEISSLDELDTYAYELKALMKKYGVSDGRVELLIANCREALLEEQMRDDDDEFRPAPRSVSPPGISDDQIRSIFFGLRSR